MEFDKYSLKILRYVYHKRAISYMDLSAHFSEPNFVYTYTILVRSKMLTIQKFSDPDVPHIKRPRMDSLVCCTIYGNSYVESHRIFTFKFMLMEVIIPITVGVGSAVLTTFLLNVL